MNTQPHEQAVTRGTACGYGPLVRDGEWVRFVIRFEVLDVARFREMAAVTTAG
jgi:hypothetical protein